MEGHACTDGLGLWSYGHDWMVPTSKSALISCDPASKVYGGLSPFVVGILQLSIFLPELSCFILWSFLGTSERSFLSLFTSKFVPILPHEYGGFASRKIPKPQNLHPKLKNQFVVWGPWFYPFNKIILIRVSILFPNLIFGDFVSWPQICYFCLAL